MKKRKFYGGPDGVFYNPKFDSIFVLKYTGREVVKLRPFRIVGKVYKLYTDTIDGMELKIEGVETCVRLGEL